MQATHDVIVLGSGFGGSLLAAALARNGMRVALVDQQVHPRFAIGESSTPLADRTLSRIAQRFHLPELLPLTHYGPWKRQHPELMCGLKRGFTYLAHQENADPSTDNFAANRLLVAASMEDEHSDTHWLRSDVDEHFCLLAENAGTTCALPCQYQLTETAAGWQLDGTVDGRSISVCSPFVVDATGSRNAILRLRQVADLTHTLRTNSRAVYAHFAGLPRCDTMLQNLGVDTSAFPFPCDAAAVHHVLPTGWMWQLRFDDDTVSAGFVTDQRIAESQNAAPDASNEWRMQLQRFPFLSRQFQSSRLCRPAAGLQRAGRLQRLAAAAAGINWAALSNTTGFIDPLHSTGIAHTLLCVERVAGQLLSGYNQQAGHNDEEFWCQYSATVVDELRLVDELVEGCYAGLPDFGLWCDWAMLYFAAVTSMEHSTTTADSSTISLHDQTSVPGGFLRADDQALRQVIADARDKLHECARPEGGGSAVFRPWLRSAIVPWNRVGLLADRADGLYCATAAPVLSASHAVRA